MRRCGSMSACWQLHSGDFINNNMYTIGKNVKFLVGDGGGPEVFTAVSGLVADVKGLGSVKWATAKTTGHDSPDPVETIVPTIRTHQPITITIESYVKTDPVH